MMGKRNGALGATDELKDRWPCSEARLWILWYQRRYFDIQIFQINILGIDGFEETKDDTGEVNGLVNG